MRALGLPAVAGLLLAVSVATTTPAAEAMPRDRMVAKRAASHSESALDESLRGRRGGALTVLDETDFESLDPGIAYYSLDYEVVYATQRPLYSPRPNSTLASPDLASGPPQISADARTVTVRLKHGVHFSPPVNREVTSADVAYAIERGANPHVANPYLRQYFSSIAGIGRAHGGPVSGITTPNRYEIVFRLTAPQGAIVAQALQLPLSAPVPKAYAARFDAHIPSDYAAHEVSTGPYMLKNDAAGRVQGVGYVRGRSATLVRNPRWRRSTDQRPGYLDEIKIKIGGVNYTDDLKVLASRNLITNEPTSPTVLALVSREKRYRSQVVSSPGAGDHYIALDNRAGPFADLDLRKAFWAALDRERMAEAYGHPASEPVASHFLYPSIPGFEQAGGLGGPKGPQFDFDEHPEGDLAVAEKYLALAGYPNGRYTGKEIVTVVGAKGEPAEQDAKIANQTLLKLGFKTDFRLVETATMYALYCNVPSKHVDVCPNVGWIADFADPQAVLDATFNGRFVEPKGNVNWSQADDPKIDAEMDAAESLTPSEARDAAWAGIDDQLVEDAAAIPFDWDRQESIEGRGVHGVADLWDVGEWDYSWTSLK